MTSMDRRRFLQMLGFGTVVAAAASTSVFDVERALWIPGEKTIFIPPPPKIVLYDRYILTMEPGDNGTWLELVIADGVEQPPVVSDWRVGKNGQIYLT